MRKKITIPSKTILTPMRAIRAKCLDYSGYSPMEVEKCPVTACTIILTLGAESLQFHAEDGTFSIHRDKGIEVLNEVI